MNGHPIEGIILDLRDLVSDLELMRTEKSGSTYLSYTSPTSLLRIIDELREINLSMRSDALGDCLEGLLNEEAELKTICSETQSDDDSKISYIELTAVISALGDTIQRLQAVIISLKDDSDVEKFICFAKLDCEADANIRSTRITNLEVGVLIKFSPGLSVNDHDLSNCALMIVVGIKRCETGLLVEFDKKLYNRVFEFGIHVSHFVIMSGETRAEQSVFML